MSDTNGNKINSSMIIDCYIHEEINSTAPLDSCKEYYNRLDCCIQELLSGLPSNLPREKGTKLVNDLGVSMRNIRASIDELEIEITNCETK